MFAFSNSNLCEAIRSKLWRLAFSCLNSRRHYILWHACIHVCARKQLHTQNLTQLWVNLSFHEGLKTRTLQFYLPLWGPCHCPGGQHPMWCWCEPPLSAQCGTVAVPGPRSLDCHCLHRYSFIFIIISFLIVTNIMQCHEKIASKLMTSQSQVQDISFYLVCFEIFSPNSDLPYSDHLGLSKIFHAVWSRISWSNRLWVWETDCINNATARKKELKTLFCTDFFVQKEKIEIHY